MAIRRSLFPFQPISGRAQTSRLDQAFHEGDLIDADEKEAREISERFFAERSSSVEVIAARMIALGEVSLICPYVARKAARHRPEGTSNRMACDINRATRLLPSKKGCIQSSRR